MKNYYYNPKTQDLTIFDTESKEMLVLERIEGIRVLTSSEIDRPGGDEPVKKWSNHNWDAQSGKAKKYVRRNLKPQGEPAKKCGYCHKTDHKGKDCPNKPTPGKKSGRPCKNCGEPGHFAKTCKKVVPPASEKLPDEEVEKIAREERAEDHDAEGDNTQSA